MIGKNFIEQFSRKENLDTNTENNASVETSNEQPDPAQNLAPTEAPLTNDDATQQAVEQLENSTEPSTERQVSESQTEENQENLNTDGTNQNDTSEEQSTTDKTALEPQNVAPELNEDAVKKFINEKYGQNIDSIEALFKPQQPIADPTEKYSDQTKQFLKFHEETGRGFEDFMKLNVDYTSKTPLELAREKVIEITKGELKGKEIDAYIERKLNIDLSDPENMEKFDLIDLKHYAEDYVQLKEQEKQKYLTPIEHKGPDVVTLENGATIPKSQYEQMQLSRNKFLEGVKESANSIKDSAFDIKIDNNGTNKVLSVNYEFTEDEVRKMTESALDIDNTLVNLFGDKDGNINYKELQLGLFYANPKNREKAFTAMVHKALAKQAEEFTQLEHNTNFNKKPMPPGQPKAPNIPLQKQNNFGIKYDFSQV